MSTAEFKKGMSILTLTRIGENPSSKKRFSRTHKQKKEKEMKLSEKSLLDNYAYITKRGTYVSKIHEALVFWNYRDRLDGYYNCVCDRDNASEISLENDRMGTVSTHSKWDNHKSVSKIESDEQKLWGDVL